MNYHYNKSHLAEFDEPIIEIDILDALVVVVCVLAFIVLLGLLQNRDLRDEVEMQKATADKATAMLAECFNGGALLDRNTNVAFFCDKPTEIRL